MASGFIGILDVVHLLAYLYGAACAVEGKGSAGAWASTRPPPCPAATTWCRSAPVPAGTLLLLPGGVRLNGAAVTGVLEALLQELPSATISSGDGRAEAGTASVTGADGSSTTIPLKSGSDGAADALTSRRVTA